jgi:hypothetical protein
MQGLLVELVVCACMLSRVAASCPVCFCGGTGVLRSAGGCTSVATRPALLLQKDSRTAGVGSRGVIATCVERVLSVLPVGDVRHHQYQHHQ